MSLYWKVLWEWESLSKFHGNENENGNGLVGMVGNKNSTFPIFCPQAADRQTLLMDFCFAQ